MRIFATLWNYFGLTTRRKTEEGSNGIRGQREYLKPLASTIISASLVRNLQAKLIASAFGVWSIGSAILLTH
jgi:hypothetical protein